MVKNYCGNVKVVIVVSIILAILVGGYFLMKISYSNKEITLRNRSDAQQDICKLVYDETWKIIKQKAQVADQYKTAFREIFPELMEGRYGDQRGGALLSFIHESNPEFDVSIYKEISSSIEAQRHKFTGAQSMLRDIKRVHDDLRLRFPSSHFVGDRRELEIKLITSTKTEKIFEEGKEDDISIF